MRHLSVEWGNCEKEGHQLCRECRLGEDAAYRIGMFLRELADAVEDLAVRAGEEDSPRLSLTAIRGIAIAMQWITVDMESNLRECPDSFPEPAAMRPILVPTS